MANAVLPDVEQLVVDYLRASSDVGAEIGDRIWPEKPSTTPAEPYALVQRLGGAVAVPRRLDGARIQIDVYGGSRFSCHRAARAIRAAMWEAHKVSHSLGVVTGVDEESGPAWTPDPVDTAGRRKPRYTQSLIVFVHP